MPQARSFTCSEVSDIAHKFFGGFSVNVLAEHYKTSRVTITRMLERATYKDCPVINTMVDALGLPSYLEKVDQQMASNRRTGRGNRKAI